MSDFKAVKSDFIVMPVLNLSDGGQVRESMNVTPGGILSGTHTTVQVLGGKSVRMDWGK